MNWIQTEWISGDLKEARKIVQELLKENLIACANIIPKVESHYLWEGEIKTSQEVIVLMKTTAELFETIKTYIEAGCSYQVPAILKFEIADGNHSYLNYLSETITTSV